jgi:hypothetical protein
MEDKGTKLVSEQRRRIYVIETMLLPSATQGSMAGKSVWMSGEVKPI